MMFIRESSQLQLKFASVCVQVMVKKKNDFQSLYFTPRGYGAVHALQGKHFDVQIKRLGLTQMKEELRKRSGIKQGGEKDLPKWRFSHHVDICSETVASRNRNTISSSSVVQLLLSDEVRLVYKKFLEWEMKIEDETSISHLIRLGAKITDTVDSPAFEIEDAE